ncbi:MAG: hypothetical protein M1834_005966 [Cirrosporium novae-zelandiae]|nr:MAG: hypothetical protein M1834_005966 [Cirrosporium novae-zelandiae]
MTTSELQTISPLTVALPCPAPGEVLTSAQWTTLLALADTVIPAIESSPSNPLKALVLPGQGYKTTVDLLQARANPSIDQKLPKQYLKENASSIPAFKALLRRSVNENVNSDARKGMSFLLSALNTRAGCFVLTQSPVLFHLQPVHVREQILFNWSKSYISVLRTGYKSLTLLLKQTWLKASPTLRPLLNLPHTPVHGTPGKGFDYEFLQFLPGSEPEIIDTDVIIVGSGCGAAVCAKNIAESGFRVIVVDKGYHFGPEYLPMNELEGQMHFLQDGGLAISDDSSTTVVAGEVFGGGGTINWSASLQLQEIVRQEWANTGLPFFTSSEFQKCMDRVSNRMGVSADHIKQNFGNRMLLEGARQLGYSAKAVPQNTGGSTHYCGYCSYGCGSGGKQGPTVSFLPDAANAGARFIEGFDVKTILFEGQKERKAIGVRGIWTSRNQHFGRESNRTGRDVIIKAERVIVSCGTLQSPLLLRRSSLSNPQLGRNLHLHPVSFLGAIWDEESRPWEGGILTSICSDFENLDHKGYGVKLEATAMHPGSWLAFHPWLGGLDWKLFCAKHKNMTGYICIARDKGSGRVYADPGNGRCRIDYSPTSDDRKHILEGLVGLAKIMYVAGAKEIFVASLGIPRFIRTSHTLDANPLSDGINDPSFQAWLEELRKHGLPSPETTFTSAHQMGTCRMGSNPANSVVDQNGKVWGTQNLYVADASVFPNASGVNPMITNMGICDWISRNLSKDFQREKEKAAMAKL